MRTFRQSMKIILRKLRGTGEMTSSGLFKKVMNEIRHIRCKKYSSSFPTSLQQPELYLVIAPGH